MKVSLNWLKEFTDISIDIDELVQKIGAQLGAVEEVVNLGERYSGIIAAKIVSCDKHPDADKLSLCFIDDGHRFQDVERDSSGFIQVVCGAPNVKAGMMVAWLPPGSSVPNTFDKEPFVLSSREIRGKLSHGMLASASELAISEDHNGIVELEVVCSPGDDFAELYKLNDYIIDIENKMFTHRPDCFGMLGVAREVAGIQNIPFKSPDWYEVQKTQGNYQAGDTDLSLEVLNLIPESVPRLCAVVIAGVQVKPSPLLMQTMLSRVGIRPINNLVDATNYMMVLTGQPLHSYDYDKVKALSPEGEPARLVMRKPNPGESLELLGGKIIKPEGDTIIVSSATDAIGLGGVKGGANTEVDNTTKNIILECANFDMYSVRRSTMQYGVFSDAATRFTKGQSPLQNPVVATKTLGKTIELAGGRQASQLFDTHSMLEPAPSVELSTAFINTRLGLDLGADIVKELLMNVEFSVEAKDQDLTITPPFWRTDIAIAEDIVEEVGRLYGYDHLPLKLPLKDLTPANQEPVLNFKAEIRDLLSSAGANECLTYSFVHSSLLIAAGQSSDSSYHIRNALSPDLQYYRQSLTPSLLDKVHSNIKANSAKFVIFEMGYAHHNSEADDTGLPNELPRLALVCAVNDKQTKDIYGAAFYSAKSFASLLANNLGITLNYQSLQETIAGLSAAWQACAATYEPLRSAVVLCGSEVAGIVGEPNFAVSSKLKLPKFCAAMELDLAVLLANKKDTISYEPLNRYPGTSQDVTLSVDSSISYQQLLDSLQDYLRSTAAEHNYKYKLQPISIFKASADSSSKNISFGLSLEHPERTLTSVETTKLVNELAQYAHDKLGARLI